MQHLSEFQQRQFGLSERHLQQLQQKDRYFQLDARVLPAWSQLQALAALQGFDLQLVSAYRGFERQKAIWQAKAQGKRDLLDEQGRCLNFSLLTDEQRLHAIMRWSAIPGLSRHHWGTDIDVFDANVMAIEDVQLVPEEVENDGVFSPMHQWLDEIIDAQDSLGFYRPYHKDTGGVAPERWHLSYLPLSKLYMVDADRDSLLALWVENDLMFTDLLSNDFNEIYDRYVRLSVDGQPQWVTDLMRG